MWLAGKLWRRSFLAMFLAWFVLLDAWTMPSHPSISVPFLGRASGSLLRTKPRSSISSASTPFLPPLQDKGSAWGSPLQVSPSSSALQHPVEGLMPTTTTRSFPPSQPRSRWDTYRTSPTIWHGMWYRGSWVICLWLVSRWRNFSFMCIVFAPCLPLICRTILLDVVVHDLVSDA